MDGKALRRFTARFSDNMNYASRHVYIPEIHIIIDFHGRVNPDRMNRALTLAAEAEPVLGCRYVPRWIGPYWESADRARQALLTSSDKPGDQALMMGKPLDVLSGPPMKGLILSGETGDRFILKVSHLVVDAGGAKQLSYLLADIYRNLERDGNYRPAAFGGSRSLKQVARRFSAGQLLAAYGDYLRLLYRSMRPRKCLTYPSGTNCEKEPSFQVRTLAPGKVKAIREYGARTGATVNDMLATAYFRALIRQTGWRGETALRQMATVDLRRYLPGGVAPRLCNLSCDFWVNLGFDPGENFDQTLVRVKRIFDRGKKRYLGWDFMLGSFVLIGALPFAGKERAFARTYRAMVRSQALPPTLTNLGLLDENRLDFGSIGIEHARVIAPATYPPAFALGVSGFRDSLDLSAGIYESAILSKQVQELFDLMEEELLK